MLHHVTLYIHLRICMYSGKREGQFNGKFRTNLFKHFVSCLGSPRSGGVLMLPLLPPPPAADPAIYKSIPIKIYSSFEVLRNEPYENIYIHNLIFESLYHLLGQMGSLGMPSSRISCASCTCLAVLLT